MAVTIGLAGAGRRATEVHAPGLASCPGVRFGGVWARSVEATEGLAQRYGVPAYRRYGELLDHCDAVAFALPPAVQADLAATAARQGKAVLLERPIAADLAGAEGLVEAVAVKSVVSQVALVWRYSPQVRRFLGSEVPATIPAGGTGRLVYGAPAPAPAASPWRMERGVLLDQGPDLLDLLDAALGPVVGIRTHGDPHGWIGLILDHQVGRFSEASLYASGAIQRSRCEVEIFGPMGSAAMDCTDAAGPAALETMFREFAAGVERGTPHELDVRRGLHLQRVIEAAETDLLLGA